jgi:hypothetical protein
VRTAGRYLGLAYGRVPPKTASVEIRSGAGVRRVVPQGRWLLAELRAAPDEIVARDRAGRQLGAQRFEHIRPGPRVPTGIPLRTSVAEILTRRTHKPIRLTVTRYRGGKSCVVLETPGGTSGGCSPTPKPRTLPIGVTQIGRIPVGLVLFAGEVGSGIASVELRFEDGRREALRLQEGLVLYQVARADLVPGRRPEGLLGRDAEGAIVVLKSLRP